MVETNINRAKFILGMQKRGQITLFIVLGILIVSVIGITFYIRNIVNADIQKSIIAEREALTQDEKDVSGAIDRCVSDLITKGIVEVAKGGGYYPPKEDSIAYLGFNAPYYIKDKKESFPSIDDFSRSIANFINENAEVCVPEGVAVAGRPSTRVKVSNSVSASLTMEVLLKESKLKSFYGESDANLQTYINELKDFYNVVKKFNATRDELTMGRWIESSKKKFSYEKVYNDSVYVLMTENVFDNKPLAFAFAIRKPMTKEDIDLVASFMPRIELPNNEDAKEEEENNNEEVTKSMEEAINDTEDVQVNYNSTESKELGDNLAQMAAI